MNNIINFKLWLKAKRYNPGTIRNYICDINKYLRFIKKYFSTTVNFETLIFSETGFKSYLLYISNKKNHLRYATSLAKYSQYAFEKNITPLNIFKNVRKRFVHHRNTTLDPVLQMYQNTLNHQKKSTATIKNYVNDVQQFIDWSHKDFRPSQGRMSEGQEGFGNGLK